MRKITQEAAQALRLGVRFTSGNTKVIVERHGRGEGFIASLTLHDNLIARYYENENKLIITDAGWQTATTKEKLNGVIHTFGFPMSISQHQGEWHVHHADTLVNSAWNGKMILAA